MLILASNSHTAYVSLIRYMGAPHNGGTKFVTLKGKIDRNKIRFIKLQSQYISESISINNPSASFEE